MGYDTDIPVYDSQKVLLYNVQWHNDAKIKQPLISIIYTVST